MLASSLGRVASRRGEVRTAALLRVHNGLVFFGNVIAAGLVHRGSSTACRTNRHKLAMFSSRVFDWWCQVVGSKLHTRQRGSSAVNARQMRHGGRGGCRKTSGCVRATEAAGRAHDTRSEWC
jgi:hypothetical protein